MNHGTNFSGDSFSNEDNVRAPIQFWRERDSPMILTGQTKTNWAFPAMKWTSLFLPQSKVSLGQIQVQKPTLVVATDQISDQT